jgi:putative MATE family efflux protein
LKNLSDRDVYWRIWSLTWPMVVANGLEMTVGLVDLLLVRPFGPAGTAAIGVGRQVSFVVEAAAGAIVTGVLTLVSQGAGAQSGQLKAVVRQSFRLVLLFGSITSLAGYFFTQPLLFALQMKPETRAWGEPYLHVYFGGLVFLWGNLVGAAICRGMGDVWTPLKITLSLGILNCGLNYLFIYGAGPVPAFEVTGAALGTLVTRIIGVLIYLGILNRRRFPSNGEEEPVNGWQLTRRILRIGVPMAFANVLRHGSRLIFLAIVGASALGVPFQAAVGLGMQVRLVGILPALAFQSALATLVGQAIGKADFLQAESLGRRSLQLLGILTALLMGTILVLAKPLATLFIDSPEAAELGADVLRWFALAQFFSALGIGLQGALMGAGDTVPALKYTVINEWAVMLPLAFVFLETGWWFPQSLLAAWTVPPMITLFLMIRRWRSGKWKTIRV